ncbi:MAG: hypothetical protein ACRD3G_27570, partial [Vicinamibacterales bacterium]
MHDIILRPRFPAGLIPFVAPEVHGHARGFFCETRLPGRVQNPTLNRHGVGKLPLFGQRHAQGFT